MKAINISLFFLVVVTGAHAQSGVVAAGGQATGEGSVSYSVGLIDFRVASGTGGTMRQGLQHPFQEKVITGVEDDRVVAVYPNPATKGVTIQIQRSLAGKMNFSLYDLLGHVTIKDQVLMSDTTYVSMEGLTRGIYFIRLSSGHIQTGIFKITKNE